MELEFQEYRARKIVNTRIHVDGPWFWDKYSASPYIGCRSGCDFCYLRGGHYLARRDPPRFDTLIQVKINAVELLRRELPRLAPEVITCGDWQQPAEGRYRLSRGMLEVVCELGFPLFIVERSDLLLRDLDLLQEINQKAWVGVALSLSNVDPDLKQAFEPRSPGIRRRLNAMKALSQAGILVGAALMPILPFIGDDQRRLDQAVQATAEHGGTFVLGAGLTMDGQQAERTLEAAGRLDPGLPERWRAFYDWRAGGRPRYGPAPGYTARLGKMVREICQRYGVRDRMPRYIAPGPLAVNKRVAEKLFLRSYDLELEQASQARIWAYRKAAWTVDEWPESLSELYRAEGEQGLQRLPAVGARLAGLIGRWIAEDERHSI